LIISVPAENAMNRFACLATFSNRPALQPIAAMLAHLLDETLSSKEEERKRRRSPLERMYSQSEQSFSYNL
jgi:hypothetical protein